MNRGESSCFCTGRQASADLSHPCKTKINHLYLIPYECLLFSPLSSVQRNDPEHLMLTNSVQFPVSYNQIPEKHINVQVVLITLYNR